jgi:hypothetical protein
MITCSIFLLDMCLSPHVVHKGIQENKCGGDTLPHQDKI